GISAQAVESCTICHNGIVRRNGSDHQAAYDELYQDNVVQVTNITYTFVAADNTDVVEFNMTKAGVDFDCTQANKSPDSLNIYWTEYDNTTNRFGFTPPAERQSLKGTVTYLGAGVCQSVNPSLDNVDLSTLPGLVLVYGRNETLTDKEDDIALRFTRVTQNRYPFAGVLETASFTAAPYFSAANNDGCEKCHTIPYLKHGYIYGEIDQDPATDFFTCKACHLDNEPGGHYEWQLEVNDPPLWATYRGGEGPDLTDAQKVQYAYATRLMNDVHMSHAMEFPYPQSMSNCVVCHKDKLGTILVAANFVGETCLSCHPVDGQGGTARGQAPALATIMPAAFHGGTPPDTTYIKTTACNGCHVAGGIAATAQFSALHSGYDTTIYANDNGVKYSEAITVTIDNASFNANTYQLTIAFSGTGSINGLTAADITPTVLVGLYGWDAKDYYIGPHQRSIDSNRNLEYAVGATHPRFQTVSAAGGAWEVTADLSAWAGIIGDNNIVRRAEIAVLPRLESPTLPAVGNDNVVAMNAPSRTFNLLTNAFQPNYYEGTNALVRVDTGCNNCHDALADTFHTPDRGGNIVVCRLCHIVEDGGSHLEMQSRSIDSYAHSIHSFQPFDIGDIDFNNNVEAYSYLEDTRFAFPTLGRTNCEACHNPGKYEVPNQAKSLPGVLSASDYPVIFNNLEPEFPSGQRNIQQVKSYVTGPAARACGGCHRTNWINEDDAVDLTAFYWHTSTNGYLTEVVDDTTVYTVIDSVEAMFYNQQ
ncbi:MAG: hypothetical protein WCF31_02590, partial [Candidatus Deferrimicrobiaceae bacterium]